MGTGPVAKETAAAGTGGTSRLLRFLGRTLPRAAGLESPAVAKWLVLGSAIGAVAGAGAIAFYLAIEWTTRLALGWGVGYAPPEPAGEGVARIGGMLRPWLLPVVTTLGGLAAGVVTELAPEAEGHGTDAAIAAIHRRGGGIRARIPLVKLVASALTIGSGGSAGREGPAAQISAGFGSLLGRALLSDPQDRRIAVAVGIGAGIGAIFRAPLGGAVLAAEILYLHDIEVEALVPSLVASMVGYALYGAWLGYGPIFGSRPSLAPGPPVQLLWYAALGLACGAGGLLYARTFYGLAEGFRRLPLPRWTRPAAGGLAVGLLGLALPQVLHTGYGWVQIAMSRQGLLALAPLVVVALPLGKILATSLTIGSGGSGGVFGPGLVVGGMLGALLWRLGQGWLAGLPPEPAPFVVVGMMALFGGISHAPLAVLIMVAEMTGTLSLLGPAMVAVAVSVAVVGDETIYREQLPSRAASPYHQARLAFPVLSTLAVRDAAGPARVVLPERAPVAEALERLEAAGESAALVVTERGEPRGAATRAALRRIAAADPSAPLAAAVARVALGGDEPLDRALEALAGAASTAAAVVSAGGPPALVTAEGMLRLYRSALARGAGSAGEPAGRR